MTAAISIAGFDPSAGAGVLSDIKTFESIGVVGFGVTSCLTIQNEREFEEIEWTSVEKILQQISIVSRNYKLEAAKIGLIENLTILKSIIEALMKINPEIKIIWDPIIMASAGFQFHSSFEEFELNELLWKLYLITPNWEELKFFTQKGPEGAKSLSKNCNILLKGGHRTDELGTDLLFVNGKETSFLPSRSKNYFPKHGSGCVLSSAITAYLSKGMNIESAVKEGKNYIEDFLGSSETLLGHHLNKLEA